MLRATLFWRLKKCGFQYDSPRPSTAFHGSSMLWNLLNLFNTSKLNINSGTSHIEVSLKGAKLNTCTFEHCVGDRSLRWFFQTRLLQPSHFRALQAQARIRFTFITHTHTHTEARRTHEITLHLKPKQFNDQIFAMECEAISIMWSDTKLCGPSSAIYYPTKKRDRVPHFPWRVLACTLSPCPRSERVSKRKTVSSGLRSGLGGMREA